MVCQLRKWRMEDAADLAGVISNPRILENLRDGIPYPYTETDGREFITAMLSVNEQDIFAFAITVQDQVIGSISASRQSNIHSRTAELGYYLAEEYWGQGIATEAVQQICEYVFFHSDILRILRSHLHTTWLRSAYLKKQVFSTRGR